MKKRLMALLLALTLVLAGTASVFAAEDHNVMLTTAAPSGIKIVFTNDAHCAYLNYDKVATLAKNADLLVDAGDAIQGDLIGTLSHGEYVTDIMNYLGYDVAAIGNHEFDYGVDQLLKVVNKAKFPYVSCNFTKKATGKTVVDPYVILEAKGKKIAFVGLTTPDTLITSSPDNFKNASGQFIYAFAEGSDGKELYDVLQKTVDEAKAKADYVVVLGHCGDASATASRRAENIIKNTNGIDAFIDAHSHSEYIKTYKNKDGKNVLAAQTGTKLEKAGLLTISADGTFAIENVVLEGVEADPEASAFIQSVTDKFAALKDSTVGKTKVALTTKHEDGTRAVRSQETNLGDLCADAVRIMMDADVALINGGGIREDIAKGNITFGQIIAVHPFGNTVCLAEVSGQQLLDALELGASALPNELGAFLQTSGLTYTINTAIPSHVVLSDSGAFVKVNGQRRVSDVKIGGEALDPAKTYKLAMSNFLLKSAGDGFSMFGMDNIKLLADDAYIDNQCLIAYITEKLGGVVGDEYKEAAGRINIINDPSAVEESKTYTVVKGDCLWKIAKKLCGNAALWTKIYDANKGLIKDPNKIYIGQELVIPE